MSLLSKHKQEILDDYRQAYFDANNGKTINIKEGAGGWYYLSFPLDEFGAPRATATAFPYRLKNFVKMTEILRRRIDEEKAEVLYSDEVSI